MRGIRAQFETLAPGIKRRMDTVLARGDFINGPEVAQLERALADYAGVAHCVSCANGTDALSLVLEALGIGEGDAVFVPAFTFIATAEAVSAAGAQPVFVDVNPETFTLSAADLEAALQSHRGARPRAVIAVDLFGLPANYPVLEQLAARRGLMLIEDAAQGFGGAIETEGGLRRAGSFGRAAITSFFPSKPLGCYGDGGAVLTDDTLLADRVRLLSSHGRAGSAYRHLTIGRNSRLDTLQAAVLLEKLEALPEELVRVNLAAHIYDQLIDNRNITPGIPKRWRSARAQYTLTLPDGETRDELQRQLTAQGIPSAVYYPIGLHRQPVYNENLFLPVTESLCRRVLSLPIHAYLKEEEIRRVSDAVRQLAGVRA